MNKLRDSIVHGQYSFDFKNDAIVIDNEDPNNSYKLKCSIPLVLLNKVSFFIQEIKYPKEYDKKTRRLIEEMHEILGIKNKNRIIDSIPALYNYMCLSFSIEPEIDYSFLSTEGLDISFDENYQNIVNGIKKKCEEFNTSLEKLIKQYNNNSNEQFRHSLMEKLAEFYSDMISKYYKRNKAITTSIRNSIEHGNFSSDNNGNIKLVDLPNQHDKSTIKFTCDATVETLYQFTNQINDLSLKDTYTLDKFFGELHKMIPDDLYEKITKRLNDLSNIAFGKNLDTSKSLENMYYEALVTVISAHSIKRS